MTRITEQSTQQALRRIIAALLMVGMNAAGLTAVGETFGYYNDTESSDGNVFAAHMLDFRLEANDWTPAESQADLFYGNTGFRDIEIIDAGTSTDFLYITHADDFSGDTDYCDDLNIEVEYNSATYYNGALTSFASTTPAEDTLGTWHYTLHSPVNHQNKICSFDIVYNGWQEEMPGYMQGGYYDTEKVENTISSWGLRINKVYYDVADSLGDEPENEWVEIFNQTNVPLEFADWELCDNQYCDTIPTSTPAIPVGGYAVISATSTTWDYWNIPDEVVKIEIEDNAIGGGLANGGDHLLLKRPDGVVIDAVGWGTDTAVWDPAALDVQEGGMLARNPSGHDTDTPADWSELLPPSVDMLNPDEDDNSQTWYWTYEYTIEWEATNHNGPDEDLSIDLSYIRDINEDDVIDEGDTEHTIATGIGNTGAYDWTVPSGFVGDIWIKLVAYGPENPMVHAFTFSGRVWDPFPGADTLASPLMSEIPEPEPMPEIEIVGNNPALVALGSTYSDMGARAYNIDGDDMSVHTFMGNEEVSEVSIDTSVPAEHTITYVAYANGYTLTGTRLVVVYEGEEKPDAALYEVPAIEIALGDEEESPAPIEEEPMAPVEEESSPEVGDNSGGDDGGTSDSSNGDGAVNDGEDDSDSAGAALNSEESESGEEDEIGEDLNPAEAESVNDGGATAPENNEGNEEDDTSESESGETPNPEESGSDEDLNPAETGSSEDSADTSDETPSDEDEGDGVNESDDSAGESSNPVDPTDELSDEGDAINETEDDTSAGANEEPANTDEEQGDEPANEEPAVKEEDPAPAETQDEQTNEEPKQEEEEAPAEEAEDDSPDDSSGTEAPDDGADLSDNGEVNA